ncbi:very short patch repair endonuclease [Lysobacter terrae]
MAQIKGRDTVPEMIVRRLVHGMGYRYRLHDRRLPGTPDLVFRKRRKVVFVHGCFWHQHAGCKAARIPKSRPEFWPAKLRANAERDLRNLEELARLGWDSLVLWECQLRDEDSLRTRIREFFENAQSDSWPRT